MRDRIVQAMRNVGISSMAELERKADIPTGTMRNIGQGHMTSMEKLRKIANTLGVTVDWLVDGDKVEKTEQIEKKSVEKVSADPVSKFFRMVASLNEQNMESLVDYLRYLLSRQERD